MVTRALARRPLAMARGLVAARSLHATAPSFTDKPKPAGTEGDKTASQGFLGVSRVRVRTPGAWLTAVPVLRLGARPRRGRHQALREEAALEDGRARQVCPREDHARHHPRTPRRIPRGRRSLLHHLGQGELQLSQRQALRQLGNHPRRGGQLYPHPGARGVQGLRRDAPAGG